jgi:hypothetical protein
MLSVRYKRRRRRRRMGIKMRMRSIRRMMKRGGIRGRSGM